MDFVPRTRGYVACALNLRYIFSNQIVIRKLYVIGVEKKRGVYRQRHFVVEAQYEFCVAAGAPKMVLGVVIAGNGLTGPAM